jgi:hypothetical protein
MLSRVKRAMAHIQKFSRVFRQKKANNLTFQGSGLTSHMTVMREGVHNAAASSPAPGLGGAAGGEAEV